MRSRLATPGHLFTIPKHRVYWLLLAVLFILGFVITGKGLRLTNVHGVSEVYVNHGKRFAETDVFLNTSRLHPPWQVMLMGLHWSAASGPVAFPSPNSLG